MISKSRQILFNERLWTFISSYQIWLKLVQWFWRKGILKNRQCIFICTRNTYSFVECFLPNLIDCEVDMRLGRRFSRVVNVFSLCRYCLPLEKGMVLYLNKLEYPSPKNDVCKVRLKWLGDENFSDGQTDGATDRRQKTVDQKSSLELLDQGSQNCCWLYKQISNESNYFSELRCDFKNCVNRNFLPPFFAHILLAESFVTFYLKFV